MKGGIEIRQQPLTDELKKRVNEGFSRHARAMTGHDGMLAAVAFVAREGDAFAGAVVVVPFWGALHVKYVFVEEGYRGKGMASGLMERALKYGCDSGCPFAFVETMSFQALGFYEKMGFELEFTRSGYAHGTSFHYLRKGL